MTMGEVIIGPFRHPSTLPRVAGEPTGTPFRDRVAVQMRIHARSVVTAVNAAISRAPLPKPSRELEVAVGLILCMMGAGMVRNATSFRNARNMVLSALRASALNQK